MNRLYSFLYALVWPFFNFVHPGRVIGRENIPEGGVLICANHTRNSDPLFLVYALRRKMPLRIMAKEEMKHWPLVGPILSKTELMIWVKRGNADIGAVKAALKALKSQKKLLIFPEGTRSEEIGEGKTGAAMMAIRAGVPILPVYIPAKKLWFRKTPVVIGEAYTPFLEDRKPTLEDYRTVTQNMMERIAKLEERAQ
jgi:1-acyl-sn-glycerol-3-phosphate acyltransferase